MAVRKRRPWSEESPASRQRHALRKRERRARQQAELVSRIRWLAPVMSSVDIAAKLGCSWQKVVALMKRWDIPVVVECKPPPRPPMPRKVKEHRPEPSVDIPKADPWAVLAGQTFDDDPRAAPPRSLRHLAAPGQPQTGNSSMAWAGQ